MIEAGLELRYTEILREYLSDQDEIHLMAAQDLGRTLIKQNIPVEEIGTLHADALDAVMATAPREEILENTRSASTVVLELLMAYGLLQREKNQQLEKREQALFDSELRFRSLFEGSNQGILVHRDGVALQANEEMARIFGYETADEIMALSSVLKLLAPDERESVKRQYESRDEGKPAPQEYEVKCLRKDGSVFWVSNRVFRIDWSGEPAVCSSMFEITKRRQAEEEIRRLNDGLEQRVVQRTEELAQSNMQLTDAMTELQIAQNRIVQAEKLTALGTLMAGVAHEINNPLMGIQNYVDYARRHAVTEKSKSVLGKADREIQRVESIITNMLTYARPSSDRLLHLDLNDIIENTIALLQLDLTNNEIMLETNISETLPRVKGRSDGLQQVLLNLLINARDAMSDCSNKRVCITARYDHNNMVIIDVEDSGSGVPEAVMAKIFDPFFSTKPPGSGTGMGLAVSKQIIESFGGELLCKKRQNNGAIFSICLPTEAPEPNT